MALTKKQIAAHAERLQVIETQTRALYREKDEIESDLIAAIEATDEHKLQVGALTVSLRDNFVDRVGNARNTAFKNTAFRRFDVVIA